MKKNLIYILVGILVIGGIFYFTLDREGGNKGDLSDQLEEDNNQGQDDNKEAPIDDNDVADNDKGSDELENNKGPLKEKRAIEIGQRLPDFTLKTLDGGEKSLSDYEKEGKIVFLNFWASWCPPCRKEMPDFEKLGKEYDDVVVVAVNVEEKKDRDKVEKFLSEGEYSFDILLDDKMEVGTEYFISSFPSTFFLDKDGFFRGMWPGMLTYEQMEEIIEDLRQY